MAARRSRKGASTALVPIGTGQVPDYSQHREVAKRQTQSTPLSAGVPRVKADGGAFLIPGLDRGVEDFHAVALVAMRVNRFTEGAYDAKNHRPPSCVAVAPLGTHENLMAPPEDNPNRQAESCSRCPHNVRGGGKACRNGIDVVLLAPSSDQRSLLEALPEIEKAPMLCHTISSTGIQPWGSQVIATLESAGEVPLFAAALHFTRSDRSNQAHTKVEVDGWLPTAITARLEPRVAEAERLVLVNAQAIGGLDAGAQDDAPPPARRRKKVAKKGGRRKL